MQETIKVLFDYRLIHIRGTPGSGKSVLCHLISNYLNSNYPNLTVSNICGWKSSEVERDEDPNVHLKKRTGVTIMEFLASQNRVLLIDEGQETYSDGQLWGQLFKLVTRLTGPFTIMFASYGSPTRSPIEHTYRTLVELRAIQRLSYQRYRCFVDSPTEPVKVPGLLLLEDEAHDVVSRALKCHPDQPEFSTELTNKLIEMAKGHVGALASLVSVILQVSSLPRHLILFSYSTNKYNQRERKWNPKLKRERKFQ